jgi:uncharacterized protein (TIGR02147 family)
LPKERSEKKANKNPEGEKATVAKPLFEYWDYREFLSDFFEREKAGNRHFSHRYVNGELGVKSSSFFLQVVQGKSNVSPEVLRRLIDLARLKGREAEYFEALVRYNQADSHRDRKRFYETLLALKPAQLRTLASAQYAYLDKWYHVAVRQALAFHRIKDDFKGLARSIVPPITPGEAKRSLLLLEKLGLAVRDAEGFFRWTEPSVTTGEDRKSPGTGDFLLQTMELAKAAIDMPKPERHLSAMTLSLSMNGYRALEEKLMRLRGELYELAERDADVDRVYHLNLHCFPMTRPGKAGRR